MTSVLGVLFDGFAYGMLLFLLSVGLSVTLGMMNFVNLAHCTFGMIGGYATATLMNSFGWPFLATLLDDPTRQTDITLVMSTSILLTSTGILVFAGVLSGLWPAFRASRLDPIEALRYE